MSAMTDIQAPPDAATEKVEAAIDALLAAHDPTTMSREEFRGHQYDFGLAWVHFDEGFGGLGVSPNLQGLVEGRIREAGAQPMDPATFFLALAGPLLDALVDRRLEFQQRLAPFVRVAAHRAGGLFEPLMNRFPRCTAHCLASATAGGATPSRIAPTAPLICRQVSSSSGRAARPSSDSE